MKKGHSAVFHNAWDQKNILIEKSIFNTPQTRKTNTLTEKTLFTDGLELRMPVKFPIFF